jgi:hypothetical protein
LCANDEKILKKLTGQKYRRLYITLGLSREPLYAYEIAEAMNEQGNKYVHEMIQKHLLSRKRAPRVTVSLTEKEENDTHKIASEELCLATALNAVYDLKWPTDDKNAIYFENGISFKYVKGKELKFHRIISTKTDTSSSSNSNSPIITISYSPRSQATIEFGHSLRGELEALLTLSRPGFKEEEHHKLPVRKDGNKFSILLLGQWSLDNFRPNIDYIGIRKDEEAQLLLLEHYSKTHHHRNEERERTTTVTQPSTAATTRRTSLKISTSSDARTNENILLLKKAFDTRYRMYCFNIRTFILYILSQIEYDNEIGRSHDKRILDIVENLSENYLDEFPFLLYFGDFVKEYSRLEKELEVPKNFIVNLLKEIAEGLKHDVHIFDTDLLKYSFTRRFCAGLMHYFAAKFRIVPMDVDESLKYFTLRKLKNYQLLCFDLMSRYLRTEDKRVADERDYLALTNFELPLFF